jgi:type III restriction enzyme
VDLENAAIIKAMNSNVAQFVCKEIFKKALISKTIEEQEPKLLTPARWLSSISPIPWSRQVYEADKCIFNLVPCGNAFEKAFAKFLDNAGDIRAFSKLPETFGFAIEYTDAAMNAIIILILPPLATTGRIGCWKPKNSKPKTFHTKIIPPRPNVKMQRF